MDPTPPRNSYFLWREYPTLLSFTTASADYHGTMPRVKITKPRSNRVVPSKTESQRENSSNIDTLASIRRGLAQARRGEGRLVDDVFDELEQEA
jgi:hypothetical protein